MGRKFEVCSGHVRCGCLRYTKVEDKGVYHNSLTGTVVTN